MEGRICGSILRSLDPRLARGQVFGAYELRFDARENGRSGGVSGIIEGGIVWTAAADLGSVYGSGSLQVRRVDRLGRVCSGAGAYDRGR